MKAVDEGTPRWIGWFTPKVRRWLYAVLVAAGGVLVLYGVVTADEWQTWLLLLGVVLGVGGNVTAAVHTPPTGGARAPATRKSQR